MTKMRKNRLFYFVSLIFVTLFFASCINITESDSDSQQVFTENNYSQALETVTLTGFISTKGALPSQFAEIVPSDTVFSAPARSAVPSITPTDYFIQAVSGGETINGTVTDGSYSIKLVLGRTYTVTAGLKEGLATLMSDEWQNVRPTRENAGSLTHNFLLKPVNTAKGFVELPITISDTSVQYVKVSCDNSAWGNTSKTASSSYTISKPKVTSTDGTVSGGITPGIYEVTISFYTGENGILLYSSTQSVTVLPNMTTNKWISGGGSAEPINSTGIFNVTSDLISIFARTQIYVGNTSVGSTNVVEGVDKGTGSPYLPFASFQKAIDMIAAGGTSTSDYNIWISGEINGTNLIPNTITTAKARSITIQGTSGNTTDTLNGNKNGTVLTVNSAVPVTIKNLKLTGGNNASGNGGGIYMGSGTKVTLGTGTLVGDVIETTNMAAASNSTYGNIAKNGGGIYNNGGTLILENGSYVSHNYAGGTEQDSGEAGGIYVNGGSVEIKEGASIRLNKCYSRGGGISLHGGCSVTITGGSIEYNEVNLWGGGIFCGTGSGSVRFEMTGGSISHNKSTLSSKDDIGGGGIYLDDSSASFTMSGTALISENYAARKGGALIIGNGSSFEMTGGTISKNWSDASGSGAITGGGAVFLYGTLKMSGNANIPFGALDSNGTLVTGVNKNDVKFYLGATVPPTVVITGALTASTTVATITLSEWKRGTTVVQANTNISGYKDYFAFTDEGWETIVASDKKSLFINQPIYVAGATTHPVCGVAGSDGSGANGTKSHPYATIAQACTTMNDETVDYILKIDGEVTGAQEIPDTLTKTTSGTYKAKSLTLCGASGLDSNGKPQDSLTPTSTGTILTISTEVSVTIKDLNIFGSESSSTPTTGLTLATGKNTDVTISNGVVITKNYNSGVKIGTQGKLTMTGGDITTNRAEKGAGVMNDGTFIMSGGFIEGNIITTTGGKGAGVYISGSGKLEMSGGYIIRNTAGYGTAVDGGGVYFSGTFEFKGGEIYGNYAYNCGGGLYADGGTLFMSGTAELGNKNVDSRPKWPGGNMDMNKAPNGSGGAIYSKGASKLYIGYTNTNGTPTVSNFTGCIKGNYAKVDGGGIYTTNEIEEFRISGGTISYNATEGKGGAIYVSNKLFLLNKAYIPGQTDTAGVYNDVYLDTGKYITVTEGLTGHDTVATITPSTYSTNTRALAANSASLDSTCTKFEVTKESDNDKNWIVNSDGKLKTVIGTRAKICNSSILFNDGSSMPWTYSSSTTIELSDTQKQNAVAYIFKQDRSTYYGISLREASLAWAKNGGECRGYNNSESTSDSDGQTNTNAIKNLNDNTDATKYPAFYWAVNYKNTATNLGSYDSNWYVPSKNEMKNALSVFSYISSAMEKIGTPYADSFTTSGEFLTSTQYSSDSQRYVSVINSNSESNPKKDTAKKVRAMRKFN